mgnify:CR=1 FL=1
MNKITKFGRKMLQKRENIAFQNLRFFVHICNTRDKSNHFQPNFESSVAAFSKCNTNIQNLFF